MEITWDPSKAGSSLPQWTSHLIHLNALQAFINGGHCTSTIISYSPPFTPTLSLPFSSSPPPLFPPIFRQSAASGTDNRLHGPQEKGPSLNWIIISLSHQNQRSISRNFASIPTFLFIYFQFSGKQVRWELEKTVVWGGDILRGKRAGWSRRVQEAGEAEGAEQLVEDGTVVEGRGARVYSLVDWEARGFIQGGGARSPQPAGETRHRITLCFGLGSVTCGCGRGGYNCSDSRRLGRAGGRTGCCRRCAWSRRRWPVRRLRRVGWLTRSWLISFYPFRFFFFMALECKLLNLVNFATFFSQRSVKKKNYHFPLGFA